MALELLRNSVELFDGEVYFTSFYTPHVAAIYSAGEGQRVLGQPYQNPSFADFLSEILSQRLHNRLD